MTLNRTAFGQTPPARQKGKRARKRLRTRNVMKEIRGVPAPKRTASVKGSRNVFQRRKLPQRFP